MKKIIIYISLLLSSVFGILYADSNLYFYGVGNNYFFNKNLPYKLIPFYSNSDLGLDGLIFQDIYGFNQIGKRNSNFSEFKDFYIKKYYFNEEFLLIKIQNKENNIKFIEIIPKQKDNYQYFSYNKLTLSDFYKKIKKSQLVEVSLINNNYIKILNLIYYFSWGVFILTMIFFIKFIIKFLG